MSAAAISAMGRRAKAGLAIATALAAMAAMSPVAMAGQLDQSNDSAPDGVALVGSDGVTIEHSAAQTFTAGLTGKLDRVEVDLQTCDGTSPGGVTVEIRNVVSGAPGATIHASGSIPATSINSTIGTAYEGADFATPADVVAGTKYAIVLSAPGQTCEPAPAVFAPRYLWTAVGGDPYADPSGEAFRMSAATATPGTWGLWEDVDFNFRTFVTVPVCPTPTSSTASGTPYDDQVLGANPAAYWRLGESSGTVADDEVGANDGTYTGGLTLGVPGAIAGDPDTAVDFSPDIKSRVPTTYPHAAFNQGAVRSFEGWACREQNKGFDVFFSGDKRFNSPGMWTDHGDLDRIWFDPRHEGGAGPRFWDNAMPADGDWFHWVLIFDDPANTAELFINGFSKGTRSVTEPYHSNPGNFQIGNYAQIGEAWNGPLDEIAIYERALTPEEICGHHGTGTSGLFNICV